MIAAAIVILAATVTVWACLRPSNTVGTSAFHERAETLRPLMLEPEIVAELGRAPAGNAGHVVFFAASDGNSRAQVWHASADTAEDAFNMAEEAAEKGLAKTTLVPKWVMADIVYSYEDVDAESLADAIGSCDGDLYYGLAMDPQFTAAWTEAELNANGVYDYAAGTLDAEALRAYVRDEGQKKIGKLPETLILFQSAGFFCGEDGTAFQTSIYHEGHGRRDIETLDAGTAAAMVGTAGAWLAAQTEKDDWPASLMDSGGAAARAETLWALILACETQPSPEQVDAAEQAVSELINDLVYEGESAFLPETGSGICLSRASAAAVACLTESKSVFETEGLEDVCRALGEGLLARMDPETGELPQTLYGDSAPDESADISTRGAAVFALSRLYGLTGEERWLTGARKAAEGLDAEEISWTDAWVSYGLNELTQYLTPEEAPELYVLIPRAVQNNLDALRTLKAGDPAALEFLMPAYEILLRLNSYGSGLSGMDEGTFLGLIYLRAVWQLCGYYFPELAMYAEHPDAVVGAFMDRSAGFLIQTVDVASNLRGYAMYSVNYKNLITMGMLAYASSV